MKMISQLVEYFPIVSVLACCAQLTSDQAPVIQSLDRNGELLSAGLQPGTAATVEWAPSLSGLWSDDWTELENVAVDSTGTIRVSVPMFYRVLGIPANPNPERLVWIRPGTFTMGSPPTEPERERFLARDRTRHVRSHADPECD